MYQKQADQDGNCISILRTADSTCIPLDEGNRDYQGYLAWVGAGNTPTEDPNFSIAGLRARKNEQINRWRLKANRSTFIHGGHQFACDDLSRSDIDGTTNTVLLTGQFPQPWPGYWKAIDNTQFAITTVDDWSAFYASMGAAGAANFAKSQGLKAQLAAATTIEQINAITW
jgi:hypothetical protein